MEIAPGIHKIAVDSNVFVLPKRKLVIDTGPPQYKAQVKTFIAGLLPLEDVKTLIFTHLHYDHCANWNLFPSAQRLASSVEIDELHKNKVDTILDPDVARHFPPDIEPLEKLEGFEIIACPGHTKGSIALYHQVTKTLFSGDTLFMHGYGRLDLPTSVPGEMFRSLEKLKKLDIAILAPGHDY